MAEVLYDRLRKFGSLAFDSKDGLESEPSGKEIDMHNMIASTW